MTLQLLGVRAVPEIEPGDDLASILVAAASAPAGPGLEEGDVLVVTSKVVSKAEGRIVLDRARDEVVGAETKRVVSEWDGPGGSTVIAETRHGLVLAAAGVDASNVRPGSLALLPKNPDSSAAGLRSAIRKLTGVNVGVVITDSLGRAWRRGQVDTAIGAAGVHVVDDLRGSSDEYGNPLSATVRAVADEMAGAAELVSGKTSGIPAVVLRGLAHLVVAEGVDGPGAAALVRPSHEDRFRYGTAEAARHAMLTRRTVRTFTSETVPRDMLLRAVEAALAAPAPHGTRPWRFVLVETADVRQLFLDTMREEWINDLRSDGFDDDSIQRRLGRGEVLRRAATLVVPCLDTTGLTQYGDTRRDEAERGMFALAMGAGTQNMLVSLAADGLGAAWVSSTLFCQEPVRQALNLPQAWEPQGCIAVGFPRTTPTTRDATSIDGFWLRR